jgi:hypothetical protein
MLAAVASCFKFSFVRAGIGISIIDGGSFSFERIDVVPSTFLRFGVHHIDVVEVFLFLTTTFLGDGRTLVMEASLGLLPEALIPPFEWEVGISPAVFDRCFNWAIASFTFNTLHCAPPLDECPCAAAITGIPGFLDHSFFFIFVCFKCVFAVT